MKLTENQLMLFPYNQLIAIAKVRLKRGIISMLQSMRALDYIEIKNEQQLGELAFLSVILKRANCSIWAK